MTVTMGHDTQMRSRSRRQRGRRFLGLALALILVLGILAPYLHPHPGNPPGPRPATAMAADRTSTRAVESVSNPRGPVGPFGPHGPRPTLGHEEPVLSQTDDTSARTPFLVSFTDALPTAGVMLAVGFVVGSLIAFAQPFMSRASRTRGQPSMA